MSLDVIRATACCKDHHFHHSKSTWYRRMPSLECRTFAQLVLHQLLEDFPQALPQGSHLDSPWHACLHFFRTNPDMQRLERSLGPAVRTYCPAHAITPAGVFHSVSHCLISVCLIGLQHGPNLGCHQAVGGLPRREGIVILLCIEAAVLGSTLPGCATHVWLHLHT